MPSVASRPHKQRRLTRAVRAVGRYTLLLAVVTLAAACRSPQATDLPSPPEPAPAPLAPSDTPGGDLPPPLLTVAGDPLAHGPGKRVYIPRSGDEDYEVTLWFSAPLDAAAATTAVHVEPEAALVEILAAGGDDLGSPPTGLRLRLAPPAGGSQVSVTVDAGLASQDGRTLAEPARFDIVFAEPTYVQLAVTGATYEPGHGQRRFSSSETRSSLPVLQPGAAVLEATFTRPVDRQAVEAALRSMLPGAIGTGSAAWNEDGTELRLPLFQNVTHSLHVALSLAPAGGQVPARDDLGMPLAPAGADLAWLVAAPGAVYAADGPAFAADPSGQLPALPLLEPVGANALRHGRLLAWHSPDGSGSCERQALTLWELASGSGLTLVDDVYGCLAWTAWDGDDTFIVVDRDRASRYRLPASLPLAQLPQTPQAVATWTPDAGVIVGAALAPGAPLAIFHAPLPDTAAGGAVNLKGRGRVDLLILNEAGQVTRRFANVSDLVSEEPAWRSLAAAWSPDGRTLAFTAYRAGQERSEAGYPTRIDTRLVTVDLASGRLTQHDLAPLDLIWRPGGQLWVRTREGWRAMDPAGGGVRPVASDIWWAFAFSPDGRYLAGLGARGPIILDVVTGNETVVPGRKPLGWDPADGRAYWLDLP